MDQNLLETAVKEICDSYWASRQVPVLLSGLPSMLQEKIPNFRALLGVRTLKVFLQETGGNAGYKLVEHPSQKARIGVIPAAEEYVFPSEPQTSTKTIKDDVRQEAVLAFLRELSKLPDSELDKVNIPVSVLVKLLK
ncbi:hypothetical protein EV700_3282 [Fluviicoccus keumensis]|uniref:Uncharacterized protein n=1 Tax=Fluviicoccus keumensis TaxID=1435465 RepID=A0A4Q7YHZ9_9GAMM|nr:hypothetical protein [Fluviicoccus keumensis]RZU36810.1 hypothetical protein EV700_3282 [Fluviicoccus keumensis]